MFLNYICFSKASIIEVFTNTTSSMSTFFPFFLVITLKLIWKCTSEALFNRKHGTAEDINKEPSIKEKISSVLRATTQQKKSRSKNKKAASPAEADTMAKVSTHYFLHLNHLTQLVAIEGKRQGVKKWSGDSN
jgi:hypothetical protein